MLWELGRRLRDSIGQKLNNINIRAAIDTHSSFPVSASPPIALPGVTTTRLGLYILPLQALIQDEFTLWSLRDYDRISLQVGCSPSSCRKSSNSHTNRQRGSGEDSRRRGVPLRSSFLRSRQHDLREGHSSFHFGARRSR